ncbi:MAG: flagellar biosynthesis protein FlhB [Balneolaceae bacterium]|nr:flagellar biosynthesis protein FlhB [Balneolaceae bacterium]
MSEQKSDQEKTEEPTQRKLEKAREEGNVSVSKEISSVILMLVSVAIFIGSGGFIYGRVETLFVTFFLNSDMALDNQNHAMEYLEQAMILGFEMMMPLLIMLVATAFFVNVVQTGGVFSVKAFQPKGSKLNPVNGIKKIFSMKGFVELVKGFSKLFIVVLIVYFTVRNDIDHFVSMSVTPFENNLKESASYILMFVGRILGALFILSVADMVYQRYQHRKDLRMTKQEVKDEYKQMEGDPHVKGQRKKFGMGLRNKKRLDHAVLSSDVVVTNPTHYAVALMYDPDNSEAPKVMAKGKRLKALRIKELAKHYGIPIVENKPVARALYATAEEDEYIPADLYRAVAEILAYVFKLKNKHKI